MDVYGDNYHCKNDVTAALANFSDGQTNKSNRFLLAIAIGTPFKSFYYNGYNLFCFYLRE